MHKINRDRALLGPFWHSGELTILFADAGVGKSTLAVQIADCLSKGEGLFGLTDPPGRCEFTCWTSS
ncbi:MAG: AAA family ATPase [Ignavibacteria bacterium]|nr:AAA family ATPase [Ignavibacteria bacterium]